MVRMLALWLAKGLAMFIAATLTDPPAAESSQATDPIPDQEQDRWIAAMASDDLGLRQEAIWKLGRLRPQTNSAIDPLVENLRHDALSVRWGAAWALGSIGATAADRLQPLLSYPEVSVRRVTAYALARMCVDSPVAMQSLIRAHRDEDVLVREFATEALKHLGPQHAGLRSDVIEYFGASAEFPQKHPDSTSHFARVMLYLDRLGPPLASDVPELKRLLQAQEQIVWRSAMRELILLGPDAADAVPELRMLVTSDDPARANAAVLVLGAIGPASQPASQEVVQLLQRQIESAGPPLPADQAGPFQEEYRRLENRCKRQNQVLASQIAAVVQMGTPASESRPLLLELIRAYVNGNELHKWSKSGRPLLHLAAANALVPSSFKHPDDQPAVHAMQALANGGSDIPAEITEMLTDAQRDVQLAGIRTLRCYGPRAVSMIPQLRQLLQTEDLHYLIQREVWKTLGSIGPDGHEAIPELVSAVSEEVSNYWEAIDALVAMTPPSTPALLNLLENSNRYVRLFTLRSMEQGFPALAEAAPELLPGLGRLLEREQNQDVLLEAVDLMHKFGPAARELFPTISRRMPPLDPEKQIDARWFAAMYAIDREHSATLALRKHSRDLARQSNFIDTALATVMQSEHFQPEDAADDIEAQAGSQQEWESRWQKLAPQYIPLLLEKLAHEQELVRQRAFRALCYIDARQHPEIVPPLVRTWAELTRKGYVDLVKSLQVMSFDQHPDVIEELLTTWLSLESGSLKSSYVQLILQDPPSAIEAIQMQLSNMDENGVLKLLNDLESVGRPAGVLAPSVQSLIDSGRPGVSLAAQRTLRKIVGPAPELLPDLIEEIAYAPDDANIESLIEYGPIAAGIIETQLLKPGVSRSIYINTLRDMVKKRQLHPYVWIEIDDTLERWQTTPPVQNAPSFIKNYAGSARAPR